MNLVTVPEPLHHASGGTPVFVAEPAQGIMLLAGLILLAVVTIVVRRKA